MDKATAIVKMMATAKALERGQIYPEGAEKDFGFILDEYHKSESQKSAIPNVRISCPSDEKIGEIVEQIAYQQKAEEQGDDFIEKIWLLKYWIDQNIMRGHEA